MLVELVQTTTRDGVRLDGAFVAPASGPAQISFGGVCMVHGTGGSFYSSTLFDELSDRLLGLGCAVLRINTRGHDLMSTASTAKGGLRQGAAYERVDDCRADLAAWAEWLRQRVGQRIGLVGHSLGAVKCLYAKANEPALAVAGIVALSPPRLSYSWFCGSPEWPLFLETYTQAEGLVEAGQPGALLEVKLPLPFVISAAGYVEKYGPEERYNYFRFLGSVSCPVLVTLGSIEMANNMAFRGAADDLAALKPRAAPLAVSTIDGADHFYTGVRSELVARVEAWLRSQS